MLYTHFIYQYIEQYFFLLIKIELFSIYSPTPKNSSNPPSLKDYSSISNSINDINAANTAQIDVDTFDHILQVTSQHEAVYAYYYMDDNNKVSFTFG